MSKDTVEEQPVSIEDEIKSIIDSGEEEVVDDVEESTDDSEELPDDVEDESNEDEIDEDEEGGEEASGDNTPSDETTDSGQSGDDENIQDDVEENGEFKDKLEAPEHWASADREVFNEQTPEAQEWLLKRHKEMEGNMTRKSQEFATDKRQFDAISDALSPYRAEFAAAGLDNAGAVRQLASWHDSLRTGGKAAILQLANMYKIDMTEEDQDIDPALASIQKELSTLKQQTTQATQRAQQDQQNQLSRVIDDFVKDTDETGKLKHPHFNDLHEDIIKLFNAGMVKDLPDAYNKALTLRPELAPKKVVKSVTKQDQAEKVKKAKKAATGIKSSGATKRKRADLTLEEEIAANL